MTDDLDRRAREFFGCTTLPEGGVAHLRLCWPYSDKPRRCEALGNLLRSVREEAYAECLEIAAQGHGDTSDICEAITKAAALRGAKGGA